MKKFNPNKMSVSAILSCAFVLIIPLTFSFWADAQKYDYDGARGMGLDSNGTLHIQIGNELHRYQQDGTRLDSINLQNLGVASFVGDLTFLPTDELLLRKGDYGPGFLESIAISNREKNRSSVMAAKDEGLFRCNLETSQCRRFGDGSVDLDRGYFSALDEIAGAVFISDSSRHTVYKFDLDGKLLGKQDSGFEFPNQMAIADGGLFLVDTNNKMIKELNTADESMGSPVGVHPVYESVASKAGFNWPFGLIKAGDFWWTIVLDSNMNKGAVFLYDDQWNFVRTLPLRDGALPVAMRSFGDTVLLTDIEATDIYRFDLQGNPQGVFKAPALQKKLATYAIKRQHFDGMKIAGYLVFALLALIGILYTLNDSICKLPDGKKTGRFTHPANLSIGDIRWLSTENPLHEPGNQKQIQIIGLLVVLGSLSASVYYAQHYANEMPASDAIAQISPMLAMIFVWLCFMLLFVTENGRVKLGIIEDQLVLRDQQTNQMYCGKGSDIFFDGNTVAIGRFSVRVYNQRGSIFALDSLVGDIFPALIDSSTMTMAQMRVYLWRIRDPRIIRQSIWLVFVAVAMLALTYSSDLLVAL